MSAHFSHPADRHRRTGGGASGTEPRTARSALRPRRALAVLFLPVFTAAAVLFAVWAAGQDSGGTPEPAVLTGLAAGCAVLALITAVDLLVVVRRLRRGEDDRP
ncbi:hypothetical protein GCM10010145_19510 [Streptomyces ruber]|uniref:Uncharacterized protein n=2 Tax=Streptomyces TaxID=1883 RepID=A0A918BAA1_9ACTN|nr:DUF6343 family protein [Streptomyces ruber]GGQ50573.1 hypothetical protein GCM10010145_19510 [Streptomyces ruber]